MRRWIARGAATLAVGLFAAWLALGIVLYAAQDALVYPAPHVPREALDAYAREVGATPVELVAADGTRLYAWHRDNGGRGALLFLHGNAEVVADRPELIALATSVGLDALVVAYRGYPGSDGTPSEVGVVQDATAAWDWLVARGVPGERIVVHGKSLGGGVATALVADHRPAALVLESTFTSIPAAARRGWWPPYPAGLLLHTQLRSLERAPSIDVPVLVLHGTDDEMIGVEQGRALAAAFPQATFVEVPGAPHGATLPEVSAEARAAYLVALRRAVPPSGGEQAAHAGQ
jgi:alpha-beta hydrolase superfamily lysophospholipase